MEPSLEVRAPVTKASGLGTALEEQFCHMAWFQPRRPAPEATGMWVVLFPGSEPDSYQPLKELPQRIRSRESSGRANRRLLCPADLRDSGSTETGGPSQLNWLKEHLCFPTLAAYSCRRCFLSSSRRKAFWPNGTCNTKVRPFCIFLKASLISLLIKGKPRQRSRLLLSAPSAPVASGAALSRYTNSWIKVKS